MRKIRKLFNSVSYYLFVAVVIAFFGLPLLWLILAPFNPSVSLAVQIPTHPTLDNFRTVFHNSFAIKALTQNNIIIAIGTMLGVTLISAMSAYALSRAHIPNRNAIAYTLMLFSSVVTGTAAMLPIFLITSSLGLIDNFTGVILVLIGGILPMAIFMMRDFVDDIPVSCEESAMLSGASPFQIFLDVALPLVRPGMMVVAVWSFVNAWGAFLVPFILMRSPDKLPASTAIYSFYTEAGTPQIKLVSAYALLYTLPVIVFYLLVKWKYGFQFFGGIKR